jgi:HK97 family phage major capsid protein
MGNFVFRDEMANGKLHGYPYYVSHFIPENLGTNGNETEIYFVAADELIIAENEALVIDVSREATYRSGTNLVSAYSLDQTIVRAIMRHDFAVRHENAVVVINQVTWGA